MNTKPWLIAKPLICCPVCGVSFNPRIMVYNKQFDATSSTNIHLSQTRCQNDSGRLDFEDFPQLELLN